MKPIDSLAAADDSRGSVLGERNGMALRLGQKAVTARVSTCDRRGSFAAEFPFNEADVRGQEKQPLDLVGPPGAVPTSSVCGGMTYLGSTCGLRVDCEWRRIRFMRDSQRLIPLVDKPVERWKTLN